MATPRKPNAKKGRPCEYTEEMGEHIITEMRKGLTLREICKPEGMPVFQTVYEWMRDFPALQDAYARAREARAEHMAEEIVEIADNATGDLRELPDGTTQWDHENVNRSRLRVDTRKWYLSKVLPKIYGDKVTTELTGSGGLTIQIVRHAEQDNLSEPEQIGTHPHRDPRQPPFSDPAPLEMGRTHQRALPPKNGAEAQIPGGVKKIGGGGDVVDLKVNSGAQHSSNASASESNKVTDVRPMASEDEVRRRVRALNERDKPSE